MKTTDLVDMPAKELLALALASLREDSRTGADSRRRVVAALHLQGDPVAFEAAADWCSSGDPIERELGADVLGQLGHTEPFQSPFGEESVRVLLALLDDPEPRVVRSAIVALGHLALWGVRWESEALWLAATHADPSVRQAVAFALGGVRCDDSDGAVAIMLRLMRDPDPKVRSWATSGVGAQSSADTPEVREALFDRVTDSSREVRGEAIVGLASRGDERVVRAILEELDQDDPMPLAIEAAGRIPRRAFIGPLERVAKGDPRDRASRLALERCEEAGL